MWWYKYKFHLLVSPILELWIKNVWASRHCGCWCDEDIRGAQVRSSWSKSRCQHFLARVSSGLGQIIHSVLLYLCMFLHRGETKSTSFQVTVKSKGSNTITRKDTVHHWSVTHSLSPLHTVTGRFPHGTTLALLCNHAVRGAVSRTPGCRLQ